MEFDQEQQEFVLTDREVRVLRMHPAWGKCKRENATALYAYVTRLSSIELDLSERPVRRMIEVRRQLAAQQIAQSILAQLEPYVAEDAQRLTDQATQNED